MFPLITRVITPEEANFLVRSLQQHYESELRRELIVMERKYERLLEERVPNFAQVRTAANARKSKKRLVRKAKNIIMAQCHKLLQRMGGQAQTQPQSTAPQTTVPVLQVPVMSQQVNTDDPMDIDTTGQVPLTVPLIAHHPLPQQPSGPAFSSGSSSSVPSTAQVQPGPSTVNQASLPADMDFEYTASATIQATAGTVSSQAAQVPAQPAPLPHTPNVSGGSSALARWARHAQAATPWVALGSNLAPAASGSPSAVHTGQNSQVQSAAGNPNSLSAPPTTIPQAPSVLPAPPASQGPAATPSVHTFSLGPAITKEPGTFNVGTPRPTPRSVLTSVPGPSTAQPSPPVLAPSQSNLTGGSPDSATSSSSASQPSSPATLLSWPTTDRFVPSKKPGTFLVKKATGPANLPPSSSTTAGPSSSASPASATSSAGPSSQDKGKQKVVSKPSTEEDL